jgi:Zn finger protein HypA/HybF involved in hydrogenase expression
MTTIPPPYSGLRGRKREKKLQAEIIEAEMKAEELPKEYDYYCPACLFQTNDFSVLCPKCGHEGLKESGEDRFRVIKRKEK